MREEYQDEDVELEEGSFTVHLTNKSTLPDVDYINDLAVEKNFSLGRSFINPPKVLFDLYYLFQQENIDPLDFDVNKFLFSKEIIEDKIIKRPMNSSEASYYDYTLLFLEQIDYSNVLGITPLDKSLNVLMYLTHLTKELNSENKKSNWDSENSVDGKNVTIPDEETLANALQEASGGMGDETPGSAGEQQSDLSTEMTKCVRDHLYDLSPSVAHVYGKNKPADVPINRRILNDIKVKAYLENTVGLETGKDTKKVKNNDSNEKNTFRMETVNEVTKVRKSQMMMENFDDKLVRKELNINTKVKPETKKQILYMLLDDSGSMGNISKQTYVRAVLLNRLEAVVEGNAELKFALYESQRYEFSDVKSTKDAQNLYKKISVRRPNGGGTYIGHILQETINEIHADTVTGYHDPEIMIVCDGDDHVDPDQLDYKDVRINVVLLGTENKGLKKVAEDTDGFYTCESMY